MVDSLSTSIDSALDDDQINFIAKDDLVKVHSVDLSGNYPYNVKTMTHIHSAT